MKKTIVIFIAILAIALSACRQEQKKENKREEISTIIGNMKPGESFRSQDTSYTDLRNKLSSIKIGDSILLGTEKYRVDTLGQFMCERGREVWLRKGWTMLAIAYMPEWMVIDCYQIK